MNRIIINIKRLFILLLVLSGSFANAQVNIDSLSTVLKNTTTDSTTFRKYLREAESYDASNAEAAINICKWVIQENQKKPIPICLALANYIIGRTYLLIDAYELADQYFRLALYISRNYKFENIESAIYTCYGNLYANSKQHLKSKEYYLKALGLAIKNKDTIQITGAYYNIASVIYENKKNKVDLDSALAYLKLAEISNLAMNDPYTSAFISDLNGLAYVEKEQYDSALACFTRTNKLIFSNELKDYEPYNLMYFGRYYFQLKQYQKALPYYLEALKAAKKLNSVYSLYSIYEEIANTYEMRGNYKEAYQYHKLFKLNYDIITNENTTIKVNNNITQYRLKDKEQELTDVTNRKAFSDALLTKEQQNKRVVVIATVLLSIFVLILIFVLFNLSKAIKERKASYIKLQERNIEIQEKSELLLRLSNEITKYQTQMNPHFIFNALNSIQGLVVNNEKQKTLEQLMTFSKLMRQTLNNSNEDSISLKKELEYLNLYVNFERERFQNQLIFTINCYADEDEVSIPPMMIQPFVENSLKHAGLNNIPDPLITLDIKEFSTTLLVKITDNGKGITQSMEDIIQKSHAVSIVKSRIKLLFENNGMEYKDSYFEIISIPSISKGTIIQFEIPLITQF